MAIRQILFADNPQLRQKSNKVRTIDPKVLKLIDDMFETMRLNHGVGLAAPQVGELQRIIVIDAPDWEPVALINPQIVKRSGERVVPEGCLSIPGWRGETKRSVNVTVKALDRTGKEIRIKASNDLMAQALENEIDHLDGVLYIDRLATPDSMWRIGAHEDEDVEGEEPELVEAGQREL